MLRIVRKFGEPVVLIGESTGQFRVRAVDLGHGHREVSCSRVIAWHEADWHPGQMADHMEVVRKFQEEHGDEIEARNRDRAARRARTRVRRLCKAMGADTLLTLTYRACVADLGLAKAHLKEFNRRMLRVHSGFRFVACFERQQRGAWHMHLATAGIPREFERANKAGQSYRVKSFDAIRAVWRSVTGELGGNIDVSRRKRNNNRDNKRGPAKIAAYIAKYIGKAFAEGMDDGVNRWAKYGAVEVPALVDMGWWPTLLQALDAAFILVDEASAVASMALDRFQDWFFLAAEPPPLMRVSHQ